MCRQLETLEKEFRLKTNQLAVKDLSKLSALECLGTQTASEPPQAEQHGFLQIQKLPKSWGFYLENQSMKTDESKRSNMQITAREMPLKQPKAMQN